MTFPEKNKTFCVKMNERSISFLIILKLCEFSGFQTKLVFKQSHVEFTLWQNDKRKVLSAIFLYVFRSTDLEVLEM